MSDFKTIKNLTSGFIYASSSRIEPGSVGMVSPSDADALIKLGQAELYGESKKAAEKKPVKKTAAN